MIRVMDWHRTDDNPVSELMVTYFTDTNSPSPDSLCQKVILLLDKDA